MTYYEKTVVEVFSELKSSEAGLSKQEAEKRLSEYGPNELIEAKRVTPLQMFFDQFKDLMVIILIFAGLISWFFHETREELIEAYFIFAIVIINAIIGFYQEYKASKDVEALKSMLSKKSRVVRSGEVLEIGARELVPGDVVVLEEGDIIPADGRVIEVSSLKSMEATLTGESLPVSKATEVLKGKYVTVADRLNMVFMGTIVARGRGKMLVTETGMLSEFGKIASLTQSIKEEPSPLQQELDEVAKFLAWVVGFIVIIIFGLNYLRGEDLLHSLIFSVAVAVAAVPEGLPAIMTITLARGVRRMVKVNTIIRKLTSVETLGSTTVICSDKTGTLTKNQMTVKHVFVNAKMLRVSGVGYKPEGAIFEGDKKVKNAELDRMIQIAGLCNNAELREEKKGWNIIGDPTEGALTVLAVKTGNPKEELLKSYPRIAELPFDSERKRMSTIHTAGKKHILFTKGGHTAVTSKCTHILENGRRRKFTAEDKKRIKAIDEEMANQALRVLAFAYRELPESLNVKAEQLNDKRFEKELTFVGLVGMIDPPREGVKEAVAICKKAGIRIFVITGDNGTTARAIAKQLGIADDDTPVVEGHDLDRLTDRQLRRILQGNVIFARTLPKHKMHIVSVLKKKGEIVAVTGDGVNDAPALKEANIGIAMGITGTDVSKEAADMILVDDSFASIVDAIQEGRTIYDNIKKFVRYIISCNIGEVIAIIGGILIGMPPVTVRQILWINLATDMLPALALGVEPAEKDIMKKPPKSSKTRIINWKDIKVWIWSGLVIGLGTFLVFLIYLLLGGFTLGMKADAIKALPTYGKALTMAFTVLVMYQMVNAFNSRSYEKSVSAVGWLTNPSLIAAVLLSIVMQIVVVHLPVGQRLLGTVALTLWEWVIVLLVSLTVLGFEELRKRIFRRQTQPIPAEQVA